MLKETLKESATQKFMATFNAPPAYMVRSPGRVNLIGEHTDYNDGFVLPMALDCATYVALTPRTDSIIEIHTGYKSAVLDLKKLRRPRARVVWTDYIAGVSAVLQKTFSAHTLRGFNAVVLSDVPMGAGLSSSASFELAIAKAFALSSRLPWDKVKMAKLCQKAENTWVGVNCGIMDQLICAAAEARHATVIDCRDLSLFHVPLPPDTRIVVMDTGTRRGLADSAYNERRAQCESVASALGVRALRDVTLSCLQEATPLLDPIAFKRAHHVISENARVLSAREAMIAGDAVALGRLMLESHHSLNQDFEVTNEALNLIVNIAKDQPGCFGARMTGAGFGGCALALVTESETVAFTQKVKTLYDAAGSHQAHIYVSAPMPGCDAEALPA